MYTIYQALVSHGFKERAYIPNVTAFTKHDTKARTTIIFTHSRGCVNFMYDPHDPELNIIDIHIGYHLFKRLFNETEDLDTFLNKLKFL